MEKVLKLLCLTVLLASNAKEALAQTDSLKIMKKYQAKAASEGVDPLGYYIGPWGYAQMEVLAQAIAGTKSLNDDKIADYIRANTFKTVNGEYQQRWSVLMHSTPCQAFQTLRKLKPLGTETTKVASGAVWATRCKNAIGL